MTLILMIFGSLNTKLIFFSLLSIETFIKGLYILQNLLGLYIMTKIKIENIIAYAQISELFDIKLLSEKIADSSYNPSEFDGLSIKYDNEKIAVIVLGTGKVVCTGAKEITDAIDKIKKVTSQIKKIGFKIKKDYKVKIENIIVSTDLKKELNLASLSTRLNTTRC